MFWFPIQLSLLTASVAAVLVFIAGAVLGRIFAVRNFRGKLAAETCLMLPLVLPPSVTGFLLIIAFGTNSWIGSVYEKVFQNSIIFTPVAAVVAAAVVAFPLMFQSAKTGYGSIDPNIEAAARVEGAGEWRVFTNIALPLAGRALMTGFVLSFTRALGEFGATLMFAGNIPGVTQTMPTAIYVAIESNQMNLAYTYVGISIFISFLLLGLTYLLNRED
ncbi:molybdate ABC transporter permease subunit [Marinococcus halophilus]|uniref:Molybdenum transport system permease n=1 Tax=Marinococcus halophilus TaxID=1371 RepID=A0A510Y2N4_MARHA|nr:molybdate ABC transporter permease subunit [Marinococcus halophilus]OZT81640.1 molybdate ABC transporter permease subunit [Marinococcus halophilus]GEK57590.1 putative molybdenum transport system permease protein YvgM [Marinococcus halophilus]